MTLTVKHVPADGGQIPNLKLLVQLAKTMGANRSQIAAAMATMIQESEARNMPHGDLDSAGLFQQRPSMGWGSYAQVTNPTYAINKFLSKYMPLVKQGMGLFEASDKVQGSNFPDAPRQWYSESWANVTQLSSGKDFIDATSVSGATAGTSTTRTQPYEFSRGNAGQRETSWDCIGRLAQEVNWDRFIRAGALWFVSETYLKSQPPRFAFAVGARGVTAINFDADSRRNAAEATVTALAKRWSVLPGDVVTISGEGPGDGLWLVSDTRRTIWDNTTEITLKRPAPPKLEPANTTTTTTVAGVPSLGGSGLKGVVGPDLAVKAYQAAEEATAMNWVYDSSPRRNDVPNGRADCSSGVSWVLQRAGIPIPGSMKPNAPVSGSYANWGDPGPGKYFTIMTNPSPGALGHIWIRWNGIGKAWRFDTSAWGDAYTASSGGRNRSTPRSLSGFMQRHWRGL